MPDFRLADAEFDRQAAILEDLLGIVDAAARQKSSTRLVDTGVSLPLVPAGGQNTMAAAAIVLLAAHFEEYVRQQIEEYAAAIVSEYSHLSSGFKEKLADFYWRAGSTRLARIRPKGFPNWTSSAEPVLRGLIEYPISDNVLQFQASLLCEHDNNMRWGTILELTGRVGIKSLAHLLFKSKDMKDSLGVRRKDQMNDHIQREINEFYELRNSIVHSISQNAGVGATVFSQWVRFFRLFTTAFAVSLDDAFRQFEDEVKKAKSRAS